MQRAHLGDIQNRTAANGDQALNACGDLCLDGIDHIGCGFALAVSLNEYGLAGGGKGFYKLIVQKFVGDDEISGGNLFIRHEILELVVVRQSGVHLKLLHK